jgi:outer membrane biosynthesis protein TonB
MGETQDVCPSCWWYHPLSPCPSSNRPDSRYTDCLWPTANGSKSEQIKEATGPLREKEKQRPLSAAREETRNSDERKKIETEKVEKKAIEEVKKGAEMEATKMKTAEMEVAEKATKEAAEQPAREIAKKEAAERDARETTERKEQTKAKETEVSSQSSSSATECDTTASNHEEDTDDEFVDDFECRDTSDMGRGVFARRAFTRGDTIWNHQPLLGLVYRPKQDNNVYVCFCETLTPKSDLRLRSFATMSFHHTNGVSKSLTL